MTDISVVILTKDEKLHIGRCLERLAPLAPRQILIVDCFSTDGTQEIVKQHSAEIGSCVAEEFRERAVAKVEEWLDGVSEEISPPPKYYRPLTEVVETVAKHQAAGFSPSTTESSIAYLAGKRKGVKPSNSLPPSLPHSPTLQLQLETPTINFVQHEWPGNQAAQFQWALDTLPINAKWILRLDADEYLTPESIEWLKANLDGIDEKIGALEFTLERKFMGGEVRHGTNGIQMVRMFRRGRGRYAETLMDERIVFEGEKLPVPVVFYDDNLNTLEWWKEKHRGYAKREAQQAVAGTFQDPRKAKYYRLPPYLRAFAYFCIRYFLKLGFLDGYAGFRWHFWQGLWYRCLVDHEIGKLKSLPRR